MDARGDAIPKRDCIAARSDSSTHFRLRPRRDRPLSLLVQGLDAFQGGLDYGVADSFWPLLPDTFEKCNCVHKLVNSGEFLSGHDYLHGLNGLFLA